MISILPSESACSFNDNMLLTCPSLDGSMVSSGCAPAPEGQASNECPSSEWELLQQFRLLDHNSLPASWQQIYNTSAPPGDFELFGKVSVRGLRVGGASTLPFGYANLITSTTQQAAIADALTVTGNLWFSALVNATTRSGHGSPLYVQSDSIHTLSGQSYQPYVETACVPDLILNQSDARPVVFPSLYGANDPASTNANMSFPEAVGGYPVAGIQYTNMSRAKILDMPRDPTDIQLFWVDLPQDVFNGSAIGAVILIPARGMNDSNMNETERLMVLCNIGAGWGSSKLRMHELTTSMMVTSEIDYDIPEPKPLLGQINGDETSENVDTTADFMYPFYPQRPITISSGWAQYLNPLVQSANRSVLSLYYDSNFLDNVTESQDLFLLEEFADSLTLILGNMVTNGLSRVGFWGGLAGTPRTQTVDNTSWIDINHWLSGKNGIFSVNSSEEHNWVKLHVDSKLQGYSYNMQTVPPRIAVAILIIYCIIAVGHLLYTCITGRLIVESVTLCCGEML